MAEPSPRVPMFGVLIASMVLAYATFGASIPLLPLIFSHGFTVFEASLVLAAFIFPSLFVYRIVASRRTAPQLCLLLILAFFFQALGPLILAALLSFCTVVYDGIPLPKAHAWLIGDPVRISPCALLMSVSFAMNVSGLGAAMSQFGLVHLIGMRMNGLETTVRRQSIGVHLAIMEACIAIGVMIMPPIFALLARTRDTLHVPYVITGGLQLLLAIYIAYKLPKHEREISGQSATVSTERDPLLETGLTEQQYGLDLGGGDQLPKPAAPDMSRDDDSEEDPGVLHALRHPWVWAILFSMIISAASASFLRPILTPRITDDLHGSRLWAASLFSLCALVGVISESFASTIVSSKLGVRNTVVLGLLTCFTGFRMLLHESLTTFGIVLLIAGSSSSLVMALTDLSQTTGIAVHGIGSSLSMLAAVTFSVGELIGTFAAGMLAGTSNSIEDAVSKWSRVLLVSCAIVTAHYLTGVIIQCLRPLAFLTSTSLPTTLQTGSNAVLPDMWNGETRR